MIFAKPSTEVSGVRSSWLTVERKALLAASASSAAARARRDGDAQVRLGGAARPLDLQLRTARPDVLVDEQRLAGLDDA